MITLNLDQLWTYLNGTKTVFPLTLTFKCFNSGNSASKCCSAPYSKRSVLTRGNLARVVRSKVSFGQPQKIICRTFPCPWRFVELELQYLLKVPLSRDQIRYLQIFIWFQRLWMLFKAWQWNEYIQFRS